MSDDKAKDLSNEPVWFGEPLVDFMNHHQRSNALLELSLDGIQLLAVFPKFMPHLKYVQPDDPEYQPTLEYYTQKAKQAKVEADDSYSILYANAIVAIWSNLEVLVKDFCTACLLNVPSLWEDRNIKHIDITASEYHTLTKEQIAAVVVKRLDDKLRSNFKKGHERFSELLGCFGYKFNIHRNAKDHLEELQSCRNCIVHRRSLIDKKMVDDAPKLQLQSGTTLKIDKDRYLRCNRVTIYFVARLLNYSAKKHKVDFTAKGDFSEYPESETGKDNV
jgi:hypothetical protein